jgi:DNA polymerase I-like protein with 3'-5' exonuclease and polymerase domains
MLSLLSHTGAFSRAQSRAAAAQAAMAHVLGGSVADVVKALALEVDRALGGGGAPSAQPLGALLFVHGHIVVARVRRAEAAGAAAAVAGAAAGGLRVGWRRVPLGLAVGEGATMHPSHRAPVSSGSETARE